MAPTRPRRGETGLPTLTRESVVAAAITVADREGVRAVTMRRVARELDTAPASLYRHISDRHDLLLGMVTRVLSETALPEPEPDPVEEISRLVIAVHETLLLRPWAITLLNGDGIVGEDAADLMERVLAAMHRAGLTDAQIVAAHLMIWHYLFGEALAAVRFDPNSDVRRAIHSASDAKHPYLHRLAARLPPHPADAFAQNIRVLIAAVLGRADGRPISG